MNVLVIVHRIPYPPDKGDKIRSYHQLEYLAHRHDVWCACLIDDPADWQHLPALRGMCREVAAFPLRPTLGTVCGLLRLMAGGTVTEGYFASSRLARAISRWAERIRFAAVLAHSSGTARYGLSVPAARRVLDLVDVDSAKWADYAARNRPPRCWIDRLEAARLAKREWELATAYDATTLVSTREVRLLEAIGKQFGASASDTERPKIVAVPNGVDVNAFRVPDRPVDSPTVGFVGMMNYPPNVEAVCWFVNDVWPLILRSRSDATFIIVGRHPTPAVQSLAHRPGVEVTGEVPDVSEQMARMRVCVAPIRMAHGVQNKVLEAMASGKPVVATTLVADGVGAEADAGVVIADQPERFAEEVLSLLGDARRCEQLGRAGRRFVEAQCRWEDHLAVLESLLTEPRR